MNMDGIQKLRRMALRDKKTVAEIAAYFECCEATIRKYVANGALMQPLNEDELVEVIAALKEKKTLNWTAKLVALPSKTFKQALLPHAERLLAEADFDVVADKRTPKRFTDAKLLDMLESYNLGMGYAALAKLHEVSEGRIGVLLRNARTLQLIEDQKKHR